MEKNYWQNREIKKDYLHILKRFWFFQKIFSVRAGTDLFLSSEMKRINSAIVLDVACGAGQFVLVNNSKKLVGIDIEGFPKASALEKGYDEAIVWGPDYDIKTDFKFDTVIIIYLNAHIDNKTMIQILESVKKHCRNDANFIFVNEYDNNNFLYRQIKRNMEKFKQYVTGCQHWNFTYESEFIKLIEGLGWLSHVRSKVIAANPPFSHYLASQNFSLRSPLSKLLCLFFDVFISQVNNFSSSKEGFIKGHSFKLVDR